MLDKHGGYQPDPIPDEDYGSGDPKVPYWIGGLVAAALLIAMHTVTRSALSPGTTLAFVLDMAWLFGGLVIALVWSIIIWVPMERGHKWLKMAACIFFGIMYYVVSGVLMAVLPALPIQ